MPRWRKPGEKQRAPVAMIYGPTGSGKTTSTIKTAPRPMRYYEIDPKDVEWAIEGHTDLKDVQAGHVDGFDDLYNDINDNFEEIASDFKTVFIDSFTFLTKVQLIRDIEEETGRAGVFDKADRPIVNRSRTDQTGYGALASQMNSLCNLLGNLAAAGPIVIVSALQADNPKWNRELSAGPALEGKKFPDNMPGFFDLIGRVERMQKKVDGKWKTVYPPKVYFESDEDESFLARWSGPTLTKPYLPLHWERILNYGRQD